MGRNFNQKTLGITEKLETDALKTALNRAAKRIAEKRIDLSVNTIAKKIIKATSDITLKDPIKLMKHHCNEQGYLRKVSLLLL